MRPCAQIMLGTADIVRDGKFSPILAMGRSWVRMVCEGPLRPNGAEMPHQDQSELFRQARQLIEQSKNTLDQTKERLQKSHCKVTVWKNRKTQEETRINNSDAQKGRSQHRTPKKSG
jgi:hypothetical protein